MKLMRNRDVQRLLLLCLLGTALIAAAGVCAGIVPGVLALAGGFLSMVLMNAGEMLLFGMLRYFVQLMPQGASFLLVLHQTVGGTLIACVLSALVYLPMRRICRRSSRDDRWFFR